jgi:hypothetical protein
LPHDLPNRRDDNWLAGPEWRCLSQGAVWTVHVVVIGGLGQHEPQLLASNDEHPLQQLTPNRTVPTHRSA